MANSIKTNGMSGGTIQTMHKNAESVAQWVARHNQAVEQGKPGDTLSTSWPCESGTGVVNSNREPGESDQDFILRHEATYMTEMGNSPPTP